MKVKVFVITETDTEYGHDIFLDVAASPEEALDICQIIAEKSSHETDFSGADTHKLALFPAPFEGQIGSTRNGEPFTTMFYLHEKEVEVELPCT